MLRKLCGLLGSCTILLGNCHAGEGLDRVRNAAALRVCIWPDAHGISHRNPQTGRLTGIDIDMPAERAPILVLQ